MLAGLVRTGLIAGGMASVGLHTTQYISNESKRSFYEDETNIDPVPGTTTPISSSDSSISTQKIVNGVSVSSSSTVESAFKTVRESLYGIYTKGVQYADKGRDKYIDTERKVTNTVSQLHDKNEDLLPNSMYVGIAALSGVVFSRQRSIFAKTLYPVILGVGAFRYFLPQTFASTTGFLWALEKEKIPEVAKQQEVLVAKSGEFVASLEKTKESSQSTLSSWGSSATKSIKAFTGLNVDEEATKK